MSSANPVIAVIYAAFQLEIANPCVLQHAHLTVTLPNHKHLLISAPCVNKQPNFCQPALNLGPKHTYHYQYQQKHISPDTRLTLHSLEECRAYLDDICHTFLPVSVRDLEITFSNGTAYLVEVAEQ